MELVALDVASVKGGQATTVTGAYTNQGIAATIRDAWALPPPDDDFGIRVPADLAWVRRHLTPHPLKTYEDRIRLSHRFHLVAAGAVVCMNGEPEEAIEVDDGMPVVRIRAGHHAMVSDPETLTRALLEIDRRL